MEGGEWRVEGVVSGAARTMCVLICVLICGLICGLICVKPDTHLQVDEGGDEDNGRATPRLAPPARGLGRRV